jgi:4-amino-4-deoxy-L-arabinose transferase-like glycosyltransferase
MASEQHSARAARASSGFPAERPDARSLVLIALACVPFFLELDHTFWGSETRWAFISRNMFESGNWLDPIRGQRFYGDKPLLSYWLIAALAHASGGIDEVVTRLPGVLASLGSVVLTGWLAARLAGRSAVVPAGVLLATAYGFLAWSRAASADPLNILFIVAAIAVWVEWRITPRAWQVPAFFVLMAVGAHAKGTPAFLIPLSVVGVDVLVSRPAAILREIPRIALATLLAAAIYVGPFVASYLHRGDWGLWDLMVRENFTRALDAYDHVNPWWYYGAILPLLFLPASLWLPAGFAHGWRARAELGLRFVWVAFFTIVLVFSASESRRAYYILPAFPFAAIGVAAAWNAARRGHGTAWVRLPIFVLATVLLALGIVIFVGARFQPALGPILSEMPNVRAVAAVLAIGGFAMAGAAGRRRLDLALTLVLVSAFGLALYVSTGVQSFRELRKVERSFASRIAETYPGERVVFYHGAIGPLRWYVGGKDVAKRPLDIALMLEGSGDDTLVACGASSCRDGKPGGGRLICIPEMEMGSPGYGPWVPEDDQYVLVRCVHR